MEWTNDAIVLSTRPHGETAAVATLMTRDHGRHAGLVQGGRSPRQRGVLQPGSQVVARWRGRLAEHLGTFTLELERGFAAALLDEPLRLAGLSSACAVTEIALPEREPHPAIYEGLAALLVTFESPAWAEAYVRWELGVLEEMGYGLDLSHCAATGNNDNLAYVSPRSGRAVSLSAGEDYRDRLLRLPGFLAGRGGGGEREVMEGLTLTGHFLDRHVFTHAKAGPPAARERFVERYRLEATRSGSLRAP